MDSIQRNCQILTLGKIFSAVDGASIDQEQSGIFIDDRTGKTSTFVREVIGAIRTDSIVHFHKMDEVLGPGMTDGRTGPMGMTSICLIEDMVEAIKEIETIGIVYPALLWSEMIFRTLLYLGHLSFFLGRGLNGTCGSV